MEEYINDCMTKKLLLPNNKALQKNDLQRNGIG